MSRMSEYQKRVQNLNLEMSHPKEENKSNLGHFVQDGIQALQSLQYRYRRTDRKRGLDFGEINRSTYYGIAQVFPHCHVSELCF